MYAMDRQLMEVLADPRTTLPGYGYVLDQATDTMRRYDPDRIAPRLQRTTLAYAGDPPRDEDGMTKWLLEVASRQTGKSTAAALAIANLVEYTPGTFGAIIADKRERADDLFRAINLNYEYKDNDICYPTASSREVRQMTFREPHNGKVRTLAANQDNVGIGRAASFLHLSELPFWDDPGDVWFKLAPAFRNRQNAIVIAESTPAPMTEPGAEWFKDLVDRAIYGTGHDRFLFMFSAFFESSLNERKWRDDWVLDGEEIRLLERFGPPTGHEPISNPGNTTYLTLENLAFRRLTIDSDPKIMRAPDLFWTFYPRDPISCWQRVGGGALPPEVFEHHEATAVVAWGQDEVYKEYRPPREDALYLVAMDPSGFGTGDPAAFQVIEVWADEWIQVAEYESRSHNPRMQAWWAAHASNRYNKATIICENTGVGASAVGLLEMANSSGGIRLTNPDGVEEDVFVRDLFYYRTGMEQIPGVSANRKTVSEAMARLVDGLKHKFVLYGQMLYKQIRDYRRDKELEIGEKQRLIDPDRVGRGRKPKHHWDRVSALMWAAWYIPEMPVRYKPVPPQPPEEVKVENGVVVWTMKDLKDFEKRIALKKRRQQGRRSEPRTVKQSKYRPVK